MVDQKFVPKKSDPNYAAIAGGIALVPALSILLVAGAFAGSYFTVIFFGMIIGFGVVVTILEMIKKLRKKKEPELPIEKNI